MPRAELTIAIPEDVWIGDLSRTYPDVEFRVLSARASGESGVGLVELPNGPLKELLGEMDGYDELVSVEPLERHGSTTLVQFETERALLLFPIQESGIPLETPFTVRDGEVEWELTASHDRLSRLAEAFETFGIEFSVDRIERYVDHEPLLTDRQRDLVLTAVEMGYYDTPRECTLTELAEAVGLAKSTCSETLHRAEGRIVEEFVENVAERPSTDAYSVRSGDQR